jgi:hypothetical protein
VASWAHIKLSSAGDSFQKSALNSSRKKARAKPLRMASYSMRMRALVAAMQACESAISGSVQPTMRSPGASSGRSG